jgi:hypothetical protein
VLSIGSDGRAWGFEKKESSVEQQFELIAGTGNILETKTEGEIPATLIFDSFSLDKFE